MVAAPFLFWTSSGKTDSGNTANKNKKSVVNSM